MIIFIVILYILLFLSKLDDLDRKSIYYLIKNTHTFNIVASNKTYLTFCYQTLLIPFNEKIYFEKYTEGGIYSSYLYEFYPKLGVQLNDKLYWANIFKKFSINHPDIICYKKINNLNFINDYDNNKKYITKPINGALGYKVKVIEGKDIIEFSKNNNNFLVQDKLFDCFYGKARHFRLNTLYNGEVFSLWMLKNEDSNEIASNQANGGIMTYCNNYDCKLSYLEQTNLDKIKVKLQNLHKKMYANILSIGWDIVIHCDITNTTCYCLEGNVCALVWPPDIEDTSIIHRYKKVVRKFYIENNI
jgi:hypothetical protein